VTGSYSLRTGPGSYLCIGVGYLHGPAIAPRVPSALNFSAGWNLFF
jgi:hypothetical protein